MISRLRPYHFVLPLALATFPDSTTKQGISHYDCIVQCAKHVGDS